MKVRGDNGSRGSEGKKSLGERRENKDRGRVRREIQGEEISAEESRRKIEGGEKRDR